LVGFSNLDDDSFRFYKLFVELGSLFHKICRIWYREF